MAYYRLVTFSMNKASTAASIAPSPKAKPERSFRLGPLTPPEIESLRQDGKRVSEVAGAWLRKHSPDLIRAKR